MRPRRRVAERRPTRDAGRQRRRFGRFVLILLISGGLAQLPFFGFLIHAVDMPLWLAAALLVLVNLQIVIRLWYLPRPAPPPVWFERWVIWPWFGFAFFCLAFAPGAILAWLVGLSDGLVWAWLAVSAALALYSAGIPFRRVAIRRVDIVIPGLPAAFDGLTMAQLTDLHIGPLVPEWRIRGWVRRVNALRPDYVLLTGDLIATGAEFVPRLGRALSELEPRHSVLAVMGNHDYFGGAGAAIIDMHDALGHTLLRNEHRVVRRNGDALVFAGVDDTWRHLDNLPRALDGAPDAPVVMLAHDPDLFPQAAERGVALQVSGHVHGGQLAVPMLGRRGSVLRPFGIAWIMGLYQLGSSQLWLGAGLGTTGAPLRFGVPSEIPLLTLRRPDAAP